LKRHSLLLFFFLNVSISVFAQVINLNGSWKFNLGDKPAWSAASYDDSRWEFVTVPSPWEEEGFNGYDGFAWYRRKFDGRKLLKSESYYLNLGFIDDCDEVYLNGSLIGFSGYMPPHFKTAYNTERQYIIPPDAINYKGENTLAIRVFDVVQGGGIVDGNIGIFRQKRSENMIVDLQGIWLFATSWDAEPVTNEKAWKKIMVPAPWEHQGYQKYDGFAWYKRTFTLPANTDTNDLILLLGKIDDFDKAYLNGQFIGKTNDRKRYGWSQSFSQLRVYDIPPALLKKTGVNTIEVLVEDMGNVGGIYEGPVGITSNENYSRFFRR
jgi:sialate O-acetylesterase